MNKNISSLNEYLDEIKGIQNNLDTFIYRGQSVDSWKVVSGVYRRIEESKRIAKLSECVVLFDEVIEYIKEKLTEIRKRITPQQLPDLQQVNDIDLLVEMQHYGGATNLIDFSFNSLIALYFACADNLNRNGQVFCINFNNPYKVLSTNSKSINELFPTPDGKFYSYSPNHSNKRIIKQDSIFLLNDLGYIDESLIDYTFIINADCKEIILKELKDIAGITEESIYPDFLGYLQANNSRKPFKIKTAKDYYEQAIVLHKKKEYQLAIDYYEKSLKIDPNQSYAFLGIAQCLRTQEKYPEALEKCLAAKKIEIKNFMIWNELALLYTYNHDYTEAKASFNSAEKLIVNDNQKRIHGNNLAWMYVCFREIEIAKKLLLKLILDEKPYHPAINLGHCYLIENAENEALKYYEMALKNAGDEKTFWKSFYSDYKTAQMHSMGVTQEKLTIIKNALTKIYNQ